MLERIDIMAFAALERLIRGEIHGVQGGKQGLLRNFLSCQTMEEVQKTKGIIEGLEAALALMQQVAKELNEPDRPQVPRPTWPRTN